MPSTHYIVQTASASIGSSKGTYRKVAVLEVDAGLDRVSMISERARGCRRIAWESGAVNVGTTPRSAYARAIVEAEEYAAELNATRAQEAAQA